MAITNLSEMTASQKEEMVASLSALLVGSSAGDEGMTADKLVAVADAAGCKLSTGLAKLFTLVVSTSPAGIETFCGAPGSGGGGGGGGGGGAAEAAKEEEKEEEEEMDMGGGMDMFGGDEAEGGGDY
jgi:ribosomal protein L12E/L44/L45/RPP1/RPP2